MAEIPSAVTDTNALLLFAASSARLGKRAAAHFAQSDAQQALTYVPLAVMWEVSLLARAGRLNLRRPTHAFFDDLFSNPAFQPVSLTADHIAAADALRFTRDPFDALICAVAQHVDAPLMTSDTVIREAGVVRILW